MRILYCTLCGKSGADIYFELLKQTQLQLNEQVNFLSYHRNWSFLPSVLRPFIKKNLQYDLFHSNVEYGFIFNAKNIPLIVTVHHIITNPFQSNYLTLAQQLYYQLLLKYINHSIRVAQVIVTVSKSAEQSIKDRFGINNTVTIYNGIDTNLFKPLKIESDYYPGKIKLLFVGNLTKRKGVDLLPEIMKKLDKRFILLYTTGLRTSKRIFSDERMIPLGCLTKDELVHWYNQCNILIFPTRLEGFGYAAAEAMACEKPVVTTNCSSLPEIVINGENGFLCKMDDVSDFVDKINILADNPEMRKEMGVRNRKRIIGNFCLEKMGREYNELYRRTIKEFNKKKD
jgi:glycosyltransferase involved in cell wall biosynthesis